MTKEILLQYIELKKEAELLKGRIEKNELELLEMNENGYVVSDVVTGSKKDGRIGHITVTGSPYPEYAQKKTLLLNRKSRLRKMEAELLETIDEVEQYISQIPKSELRMMFQFYYMEGMTWPQVALRMNDIFPKRKISYSEDSCRMQHNRYLQKNK